LADTIEMLIRDTALIEEMGRSARRHVLETHHLPSVVSSLVKYFAEGPASEAQGAQAAA
jgi:hypothetical protein